MALNSSSAVEVQNSSLNLHGQEDHFLNLHLHPVSNDQWIIYGLTLPILVGLSLLLNGLIFVVLFRDKIQSSLHLLLHCLSCYDIAVSLMSFWIFSIPTLFSYLDIGQDYNQLVHPQLVPWLLPIWHMAVTGSDYLNLAAACERYLATDRYFKSKTEIKHHLGCSPKSTKFYILKIFCLTVLFNIPAFFELQTIENEDENLQIVATELRSNKIYTQMYRLMAEFLIFKVTPWITFLVLWLGLSRRIG